MNLPDDCDLTYSIASESWYYDATKVRGDDPYLMVHASSNGGGVAWEFTITEHDFNGGCVRVAMFSDSFDAWAQVPELFDGLREEEPTSLGAVRAILDGIGARDETARVAPSWHDPRSPLVAKVEEAQAELARYDAAHPRVDA